MRYNDKIRERVIAAYRENPNSAAITKRFGVTAPTILNWVKKEERAQAAAGGTYLSALTIESTACTQMQAKIDSLRDELNQAYIYIGQLRVHTLAQTSSPQKS